MADGLDINILTGKVRDIAVEIDSNNVKDGKISEKEISIFLAECEKNGIDVKNESWYAKYSTILSNYMDNVRERLKNFVPSQYKNVAQSDATKVVGSPEVEMMKRQEDQGNDTPSLPKPLKLGTTSNIRTNYDWSEEGFSNVLNQMLNAPRYKGKFKKSVLQGKSKAFIEAGKKFNIDPRILVAIAMCESERGISQKAKQLNNIGGLKIGGKYHHFETVEASIDSIAKTMESRYDEGFTTPSKIAYSGKYCAKDSAKTWLSNIRSYLSFFDKYYKD